MTEWRMPSGGGEVLGPAEMEAFARRTLEAWLTSGRVHEAMNYLAPRQHQPMSTPDDVMYEQWEVIIGLLGHAAGRHDLVEHDYGGDDMDSRWLSGMIATKMMVALPYLWLDEMRMVAASPDNLLPPHEISLESWPEFVSTWWTWETDLVVKELPDHTGKGLLIQRQGDDSLWVADVQARGDTIRVISGVVCVGGWQYPSGFPSGGPRSSYETIARMKAFVDSPFIMDERRSVSRAMRRRHGLKKEPNNEIHFITLRRPASKPTESDEQAPVDWQYQWLVSGHYRNQWYATSQSHRLIWVAPYVKGPEDKPLKPRAFKVAQ